MSNSIATGVAYADPEFTTCYVSEELGYALAAQGAVTQLSSKSTAVTLNKSMGKITMNNAALAGGSTALFTLNNSTISDNDVVVASISGGATAGAYWPFVADKATGSATIGLYNNSGGSLSEAVVVNFVVIHGVS
jgi:uncharacterized cupredoxin-like copper-binding protein